MCKNKSSMTETLLPLHGNDLSAFASSQFFSGKKMTIKKNNFPPFRELGSLPIFVKKQRLHHKAELSHGQGDQCTLERNAFHRRWLIE